MLKFIFEIEPWDQIKSFRIATLHGNAELEEGEDFISYEFTERGLLESVSYKFRLRKRPDYKEYLRDFIQLDVDILDLKNLVGIMSYFREVYQNVLSLFRRGMAADLVFRWRDKEVHVLFGLHAVRSTENAEIEGELTAEYQNEYLSLRHRQKTEYVEDGLEHLVKEAVGLYLLFKEYTLQEGGTE